MKSKNYWTIDRDTPGDRLRRKLWKSTITLILTLLLGLTLIGFLLALFSVVTTQSDKHRNPNNPKQTITIDGQQAPQ